MTADQACDQLSELGIATDDELALVSSICGHNLETFEAVLFSRCGLRSFDQLDDENGDDDES